MTTKSTQSGSPSRRAFLAGLTATAAIPVAPAAFGQTPASLLAADTQAVPAEPNKVDSQLAIVTAQFGAYLQSADISVIRRGLERINQNVAELQKRQMHNGDAPDCLFYPDGV